MKNSDSETFGPCVIRTLSVPVGFDHSVTRRVAVEMVTVFRP